MKMIVLQTVVNIQSVVFLLEPLSLYATLEAMKTILSITNKTASLSLAEPIKTYTLPIQNWTQVTQKCCLTIVNMALTRYISLRHLISEEIPDPNTPLENTLVFRYPQISYLHAPS